MGCRSRYPGFEQCACHLPSSERKERAFGPVQLVYQQWSRGAERDLSAVGDQGARVAQRRRAGAALSAIDESLSSGSAAARRRVQWITDGSPSAIPKRHVDLHSVFPDDRFGKDVARLALQLSRVAGVARRKMRKNQPADAGRARNLRSLPRRRMASFGGTFSFFVSECGLVDQQIRVARRFDRCGARSRVASDDDRSTRTFGAHQARRFDNTSVIESNGLPTMDLSPERPFGNSQLASEIGVEPALSFLFRERESGGCRSSVVDGESNDCVSGAFDSLVRFQLDDLEWES